MSASKGARNQMPLIDCSTALRAAPAQVRAFRKPTESSDPPLKMTAAAGVEAMD